MRAEREKREKILLAEGEKQKKIKNAEGDAAAIVAVKEAEAQGIIKVREAEAQGLEALKRAGVDEAVLKLKSYEALGKVAEGQATKLIIPSDLTNLASIVSSVSEIVKK